jgi:polyhydroxyalkanoate synthesis regulator phasin
MVRDALRGYLNLASGLTEVTFTRATTAARALVAQGEATAEQVTSIADDLVTSSRRNREAIVTLVRYEIEQALRRVGLAPAEEVTTLTERVRRLESSLREARSASAAPSSASAPAKRSAKKSTKKAAAKKSTKKATTNKSAPSKRAAAKQPAAKQIAVKRTAVKRTTKRTAAKKTAKRAGTARSRT